MSDPVAALNALRRCTRCALPETHESIVFDEFGVCSICRNVEFKKEQVDWEEEFARPLKRGVDTFRAYVTAWYDGRFQDIVFSRNQSPQVRRMVCSILAGYAWDESNPLVAEPERRLDALAQLCAA